MKNSDLSPLDTNNRYKIKIDFLILKALFRKIVPPSLLSFGYRRKKGGKEEGLVISLAQGYAAQT